MSNKTWQPRPAAPKPTLIQRAASATQRTILNLGDEAYGHKVDWAANARRDKAALEGAARDEAYDRECLELIVDEHAELVVEDDPEGTEFVYTVEQAFIAQAGRELNASEYRFVRECVDDIYSAKFDGGER